MKKQILNLGKALDKAEQKEINGGVRPGCTANVHFEQCIEGPGTVFYSYYRGGMQNPYGDCCVFLV